jgi:hypothetical protein
VTWRQAVRIDDSRGVWKNFRWYVVIGDDDVGAASSDVSSSSVRANACVAGKEQARTSSEQMVDSSDVETMPLLARRNVKDDVCT